MQVANAVARTKFLFINIRQGGKDFLPPLGGKGSCNLWLGNLVPDP
jgi:hypothetical protein